MSAGTLIIGASQAGVQLAASLRESDPDQPITLIGAERHPPYQRPPLSKAFLGGDSEVTALAFRTPAFYDDQRITLIGGDRVEDVTMAGPAGAGIAKTRSGRTLSFDHLALTVGARPRRLTVPGADFAGVCYLRDADDALHLRERLGAARQVVVIGGGFIGLEAAAVARSQGKDVTVVEAADRLISRSVAPVVSDFYREAHLRRGSQLHLGAGVTALQGDAEGVTGVQLADGTELPADLVLVGVGIVPRTELAECLGLDCQGGIVVDEYACTSHPGVVAAGDCTVFPNPITGAGLVRLESVQNAVAQARVAAATVLGVSQPHHDVPWFWSDQFDLKLQIAGLSAGYDHCVVRGDPASDSFSVLYFRAGAVLAVDAVNKAPDYLAVRKALSAGFSIKADSAADPDVTLKSLLQPA